MRHILTDAFLRFLGRYVLIPVAALHAVGLLTPATTWLDAAQVNLGNIQFSVLTLIRGAIAGALLFWLGGWSNRQSADYIKAQAELRPATRELAIKATEVAIFGAAFLLLMSIMGIDLTAVAVLGGALASASALVCNRSPPTSSRASSCCWKARPRGRLRRTRRRRKGHHRQDDRPRLHPGNLRRQVDRRPNEHFITTRVVNYSDQGSANRYEALFSVAYETDINIVPEIVETAVAALPFVLKSPDGPDCELRAFGESSVDFAVEYWVNGIDDGKNKYGSPVLFAIWNALKEAGIEMPYPRRVVELRSDPAKARRDRKPRRAGHRRRSCRAYGGRGTGPCRAPRAGSRSQTKPRAQIPDGREIRAERHQGRTADRFLAAYHPPDWLVPMLRAFGPEQVQDWCRALGQPVFTGSSGRVFPVAMKGFSSPPGLAQTP